MKLNLRLGQELISDTRTITTKTGAQTKRMQVYKQNSCQLRLSIALAITNKIDYQA